MLYEAVHSGTATIVRKFPLEETVRVSSANMTSYNTSWIHDASMLFVHNINRTQND